MTNFAYLRVSTDQQDIKNQKFGLLEYCNNKNIMPIKFVEETVSGKINWREREIGKIIEQAQEGDVIVASEISRLGRSPLQVLEIIEAVTQKKISLHITKNNMVIIDNSIQSTITATMLGLAAQIEKEFISARTKEALAKRKADGMKLGRPKGKAKTLKLDDRKDEIIMYLKKDINKRTIAKLVECSRVTLYEWLRRRKASIN